MTETPLWLETPMSLSHLPVIEQLARELYDAEPDPQGCRRVPWEQLRDDERDDLLHQVRAVLAVVGRRMPGVLALLPHVQPASSVASGEPRADAEHDPLLLTGS